MVMGDPSIPITDWRRIGIMYREMREPGYVQLSTLSKNGPKTFAKTQNAPDKEPICIVCNVELVDDEMATRWD